jgi:hypothetical protein
MPSSVVKSFADKTGKSEQEVDKLWNKAKEIAAEQGQADNYALITGILKKMLKLNETLSFKEFLDQESETKSE